MSDGSDSTVPHDLNEVVAECLRRLEDEGPAALTKICTQHPQFADQLRARVRMLADSGLLDDPDAAAEIPERLGDFRLLRRLGGGGMGVVYLAVQESLGREVALKLIRGDQLYFPGARERFHREVDAVARMQHPSIVPVHAVGEEDGVPYFAMERIVGASLQQLVAELLGTAPFEVDERDLPALVARIAEDDGEPQTWKLHGGYREWCLSVVLEIARALEHAHQRGVLHRDLKPSNVLIGVDGRVHLVDFGLAMTEGGPSLTATGTRMGSLPYMAPEQVEGRAADATTDVYGLGATLYELLTFRPPFGTDAPERLPSRILYDEPRSPRLSNPSLVVDDESVCLKALEKEPDRRYETARSFAEDLENLLERRPVRARPTSRLLRLKRLVQRRPAASAAVALAFLVVVVAPTVFAMQQRSARIEITAARDESDRQRARAEANLRSASEAVDYIVHKAGARLLQGVPLMDRIRRVILERAVEFYEPLLEQEPTSPRMRFHMAMMRRSVAQMLEDVGRRPESGPMFDAVIAEFDALRSDAELGMDATLQLAVALATRGEMDAEDGDRGRGFERWIRARELFSQVESARADDHKPWFMSATNDMKEAQLRINSGEIDRALELIDRAVEHASHAIDLAPSDDECQSTFAMAYVVRAGVAYATGDFEAAAVDLERSVPALRELLDGGRPTWNVRRVYIAAVSNWGAALVALDRAEEAADVLRDGIEVGEALIAAFPTLTSIVFQMAQIHNNLGMVRSSLGDDAGALAAFERAVELNRAASDRGEQGPDVFHALALSLGNLAARVREGGDVERADALLRDSLSTFERAADALGADPMFGRHLVCTEMSLADNEIRRENFDEALEVLSAVRPDRLNQIDVALMLSESWLGLGRADVSRADLASDRALDALQRAVELGLQGGEALEDPVFDPLRQHARFRSIETAVAGTP